MESSGGDRDARLLLALGAEGERLVRRLRDFSAARYQAAAPPFPDRAAAVRHLAQQAADTAATLEAGARRAATPAGAGPALHTLPADLPDLALADVLAVTLDDVSVAATARGAGAADLGGAGPTDVADALAALLAELLLHRWDVDHAAPGPALSVLAWPSGPPGDADTSRAGRAPSVGDFLAMARRRCPGPRLS